MTRMGLAAVMAAGMVIGTAGIAGAKAKEVSPEKYAKTLCGTFSKISTSETDLAGKLGALDKNDPVAYQSQASELASQYQQQWAAAAKKLKKKYPGVDDGKKIGKKFSDYAGQAADEIQSAIDTFRAADPHGVAFAADVATFGVAFQTLSAKLGDPFSEVTDQDVLGAFKDEKSCDEIVTIF